MGQKPGKKISSTVAEKAPQSEEKGEMKITEIPEISTQVTSEAPETKVKSLDDTFPFSVTAEKESFLSLYELDNNEIVQGEGSFFTSTRKCVRKRDGALFLAKRVEGEAVKLHGRKIAKEAAFLQNMQGRPQSIVHLEAFFQTENEIVLVFPLAVSDLYDHLIEQKTLQSDEIRYLVREVLEAVAYLHERRIFHRNLKTEVVLFMDVTKPAEQRRAVVMTSMPLLINVLREIVCEYEELPPRTLLTGFSLCELLHENENVLPFAGTPEYMAPEVVNKSTVGTPSDMWAIGCMMFELFEGVPPYYNENVSTMYQLISMCAPLKFVRSPHNVRDLISRLLTPTAKLRPSAAAVLADPFFCGDRHGSASSVMPASSSSLPIDGGL